MLGFPAGKMTEAYLDTFFSNDYTQTFDSPLITHDTQELQDASSVHPSESEGTLLSYNGDYPGIDWEPNGQHFTFGVFAPGDTDLSVYDRGDFEVSMSNHNGETSNVGSFLDNQIPGAAITSNPLQGLSSQSGTRNAHHTKDDHGLSRGTSSRRNFLRTRSQFSNLTECDGCHGSIPRPRMEGQAQKRTIAKEGHAPKYALWCHDRPKCWSACITEVQADRSTLSGGLEHAVNLKARPQNQAQGRKKKSNFEREKDEDTIYPQVLYPCESCRTTIFCRMRMKSKDGTRQKVRKPKEGRSMLCRLCC